MTFEENPCRRNAFDAFAISTDEVSIKTIRRVIADTRADWKDSKKEDAKGELRARDGSLWKLTEARLVSLEESILDPLQRLQIEQFVHREHPFQMSTECTQLVAEVRALADYSRLPQQVLDELSWGITSDLGRFVPEPHPAPVTDDLPWPDPPAGFRVEFEPYQEILLRDR